MKFIVLSKRSILIFFLLIIIGLSIVFAPIAILSSSPHNKLTIVIDAGHGGIDGGSVGVFTKVDEATINLEYARCLKAYFDNFDYNVVLTRDSRNGLYSAFAKNKKKDDMQKRKEIIEKSDADIVVSIHMNSFPRRSSRGAQAFYKANDEAGMVLANSIQKQLKKNIEYAKATPQTGDYYILNCTSIPSVLVECGFLSNIEEDQLLSTDSYKDKICYAVFCGIISYIGVDNI